LNKEIIDDLFASKMRLQDLRRRAGQGRSLCFRHITEATDALNKALVAAQQEFDFNRDRRGKK
jgi:hypothetical protein